MRSHVLGCLCFAASILTPCSYAAAAPARLPVRAPLPLHSPVEDKLFYLLSAITSDSQVRSALGTDAGLREIAAEREDSVQLALQRCKEDVVCTLEPLLWSDEEIHAVSLALRSLYNSNPAVQALVEGTIRPSGAYVLDQSQSGEDLLASAWESSARGIDRILSVYGEGAAPRYPKIDAISFDLQSEQFKQRVQSLVRDVAAPQSDSAALFEPSLKVALQLLAMNHRDEAGRFEPMEAGENKAAVRAIRSIPWSRYPYSVIVVPGAGPNDPEVALSEAGRKRIALAAERYHAGQAPLILVSGGFVHPAQTRFSEAIEMKDALLREYQIPEAAILVDPHARHTTTNLRNAAREMYRYNIPLEKPGLIVSDASQIGYIHSKLFADRCLKELGYLPYQIVRQISDTELAFRPTVESLQEDPIEPLDP
ncbi:MAG TPA: YdcF family protein [Acidobacteriaceae bacterium]|nr:YdcF family protein [Acidobacteriaceae bacterium]